MPHELQLILSVPNCHWRIPPCGHFLTRNLLSTFDVPQAKPIYPPPTVTLGPFLSLCPQGQPGGGLSRQAGLRELHLTPPAQHCLLRPLWECCAICRPQTFYEQEDRKKFSSIDPPDHSQACSLPLLFIGLLGDEGDKVRLPSQQSPEESSPVPGPLPSTSPGPD